MSRYLLAVADNPQGLPRIVGVLVATGEPGHVAGEAAVGAEVRPDDRALATELLQTLPGAGDASAEDWLAGLAGSANGTVRLTGPWTWSVQDREVLHWSLDDVGLTARAVALVREGKVQPYPDADRGGSG